ncbi:MAG: hypothetical protein HGA78_10050 [Nitrospirales bacterium]|nr:hypothetical protein [Nitrospirales bacterium]
MPSLRKIASPYSLRETVGVVKRNLFGIDKRRNCGIVEWAPPSFSLYHLDERICRISFVGDIMSMGNRRLVIDDSVREFIAGSQYLVGNFEATITENRRRKGVIYGALERHRRDIAELLSDIFPPEKTFLSLANNHTGDYSDGEFRQSLSVLEDSGFNLFGLASCPVAEIGDVVRIVAATMWSNQLTERVHWLRQEGLSPLTGRGCLNLLYSHWGYEMELFPRPEQLSQIREAFGGYDAVIGHHSHTVQPVVADRAEKRLVAYSLGDFCSALGMSGYRCGIVMNVEVGCTQGKGPAIGDVRWCFVESAHLPGKETVVSVVEEPLYLRWMPRYISHLPSSGRK